MWYQNSDIVNAATAYPGIQKWRSVIRMSWQKWNRANCRIKPSARGTGQGVLDKMTAECGESDSRLQISVQPPIPDRMRSDTRTNDQVEDHLDLVTNISHALRLPRVYHNFLLSHEQFLSDKQKVRKRERGIHTSIWISNVYMVPQYTYYTVQFYNIAFACFDRVFSAGRPTVSQSARPRTALPSSAFISRPRTLHDNNCGLIALHRIVR